MVTLRLKVAMALKRDWLPYHPKGTRVVVDKVRSDAECVSKVAFHVCEPHLPMSGDGWIDSSWFEGYHPDRSVR